MIKVYMYVLLEPQTLEVHYVGKTKNPIERYKNHLNSARDKNTHKRRWILSLTKKGLKPILKVIDTVDEDNWQQWEKYSIDYYIRQGASLVNYTEGGDGLTYGNSTTWRKGNVPWNKGIPVTETRKAHISKTLMGNTNKQPKTYVFINPDGLEVEITNLHLFCKNNKLSDAHMNAVYSGKRRKHKGWTKK